MDIGAPQLVNFMTKKIKYKIKKLKVHKDERGWLVELLKSNELEEPVRQIHITSIKPGCVRGNHYHSKRIEWFFLIVGEAKVFLQDIKTKKRIFFKLSEKEPKVITIYPYISHAVKNTGKNTAYLVAAQSDIYDPKCPDASPWEIIK